MASVWAVQSIKFCSSCPLSPLPDFCVAFKAVARQWGEKGEGQSQHVQDQLRVRSGEIVAWLRLLAAGLALVKTPDF